MTAVEEKARRVGRIVGRGRDERTPVYLHFGVLAAVGVVVGVIVGLVFLAQALAS
jgi:hypothetical protein